MSGGTFDYKQWQISEIIGDIEVFMERQQTEEMPYIESEHAESVKAAIEQGLICLRKAAVYAQRIDWFIAGDDGAKTFLSRLKDELAEIK